MPIGNFLKNTRTVLKEPRMAKAYLHWKSYRSLGFDPKIKTPYCSSIGHLRHFSEFWSVTNNIYKMTLDRESKLVKRVLDRGGYAFDIGANVGVF